MKILLGIISYARRNLAEIVNLIEAVLRVLGSIVSLTPTQKDDSVIASIKSVCGKVKSFFSGTGK